MPRPLQQPNLTDTLRNATTSQKHPRPAVINPRRNHSSLLYNRPRKYATISAYTPAATHKQMTQSPPPLARYPPTQPPSFKPPEARKSQLIRIYASILRSSPLILIFQHNNLKANEWISIRRELYAALNKVDDARAAEGHTESIANITKIQVIQSRLFGAALKIVEYYKPETPPQAPLPTPAPSSDPSTSSSANPRNTKPNSPQLTHALSAAAHEAVVKARRKPALSPLLSGPLAVLIFPTVSPQYLKAALSILAPHARDFPAPKRSSHPGWHERPVQSGLQKLMLLGARVEGQAFDVSGTRWVGGIEGGLEGLRGNLVQILEAVSAGLTDTLEGPGRSLYFTLEGRRMMLEGETGEKSGSVEEKKVQG